MRFSTGWRSLAILTAIAVPILVSVVTERVGALTRPAVDPIAQARALVLEEIAPKVPGFAVAVAIDGRIVWSEGFGYADLEARRRVTATTPTTVWVSGWRSRTEVPPTDGLQSFAIAIHQGQLGGRRGALRTAV